MGHFKLEIKWGLVFAAMVAAWMGMEKALGLHDRHIGRQMYFTSLILLPAIVIYFLALLDAKKSRHGGAMTYGQGIRLGLGLTLVVALLSPLNQALASFVISPDYFDNATRFSVEMGYLDPEAARRKFSFGSYLVQGFIGALVTGAAMTAILAGIVRRKRPIPAFGT